MPSKSSKDTNAPKKALSAYILFAADERPKLKASGLENFAEMSRALGAAWKQADAKTRVNLSFLKLDAHRALGLFRLIMRKRMKRRKFVMKTN